MFLAYKLEGIVLGSYYHVETLKKSTFKTETNLET